MELTSEQRERYAEDGYLLVPSVFSERECDAFVAHVLACKDAQQPGGGPYRARSRGGGALDPASSSAWRCTPGCGRRCAAAWRPTAGAAARRRT